MSSERHMYELEYPSPEIDQNQNGPLLLIALEGYADAGQAVAGSSQHLLQALDSRLIASFNTDELVDFRSRRPMTTIDDQRVVDIEDLSLEMRVLRDTRGRSFLLLSGPEPDLRWEGFTQAVVDLVERFGVRRVACLYSAPMTVPHTRPLVVSGHANDADLLGNLFTFDGLVSVPGSATLHIERKLVGHGQKVAGYTAHVPHYVASSPYPEAVLRLLSTVGNRTGLEFPLGTLEEDTKRVAEQLAEQTAGSAEIRQVVSALERQYDDQIDNYERNHHRPLLPGGEQLPSSDELAAKFQDFLASLDDDAPEEGEEGGAEPEDGPDPGA